MRQFSFVAALLLVVAGAVAFPALGVAPGDRGAGGGRAGGWAFWLYKAGLGLRVTLNFFPIGWTQLMDVYEHGLAHARSLEFYNTVIFWQWMRMPGDIVFAAGA